MMGWGQSIDLYCERTDALFWSEPANALSNIAFIMAGLWGLHAIRKRGADAFSTALAWLAVAIGVGSFLFHTDATRLTIWADIVPIAAFTLSYTVFTFRRYFGLSVPAAVGSTVGTYAVTGLAVWLLPAWVHAAVSGSTGYLPPLLALLFTGLALRARGHGAGLVNLSAAALFAVSATFRILDPVLCAHWPLGTHFLWHLFNGLMLGVVLAGVARLGAPALQREEIGLAGRKLPV